MKNERQRNKRTAGFLHGRWGLFVLGLGLLVGSCSKNPDCAPYRDTSAPIVLSAGMTAGVESKAAIEGDKFPALSPAFFLTAYNGTSAPSEWSAPYFSDKPVNSDGSGVLSWPQGGTQYYPADVRQKLYFYAYAPRAAVAAGKDALAPVASYAITGQEDILWAKNIDGIAKPSAPAQPVPLNFAHKLMQVKFQVVKDASFSGKSDRDAVTSIKITKVRTSASLNLGTGVLTFAGDASATLAAYEDEQGVLVKDTPTAVPGNVMFEPQATFTCEITAGGVVYKDIAVTLAGDQVGQEGVSYLVTLTFKQKEIVVGATVAEWIDGGKGTGDGTFVEDEIGTEGTVPEWGSGGETQTGSYPYVLDGTTIVLKDLSGQADGAVYPLHLPWNKTFRHVETQWDSNVSGYNLFGSAFRVAASDAAGKSGTSPAMSWYEAAGVWSGDANPEVYDACGSYSEERDESDKGTWRLPSMRELKLIYDRRSELTGVARLSESCYWSATADGNDRAWSMIAYLGLTEAYPYSEMRNNHVRCIRDEQSGALQQYPYVEDGNTLVVNDGYGLADASRYPTHEPWLTTPAHSESPWYANASGYNTVAEKFAVASADANRGQDIVWKDAASTCAAYAEGADDAGTWRVPTIRELKLIYDMKDRLPGANLPAAGYYWSATQNVLGVNFSNGNVSFYNPENGSGKSLRCVRDVGAEFVRGWPYVLGGSVIVVKDGVGQADASRYPTHGPWSETPAHRESAWDANASGSNTLGEKFEVASKTAAAESSTAWTDAAQLCESYTQSGDDAGTWRLPTIRELKLIYDMKARLSGDLNLRYSNHWSATEKDDTDAWRLNMANGGIFSHNKVSQLTVRCVRDL